MQNGIELNKEDHKSILGAYLSGISADDLRDLARLKDELTHASSHLGINSQGSAMKKMNDIRDSIIEKSSQDSLDLMESVVSVKVITKTPAAKDALTRLDAHEDSGGEYSNIVKQVAEEHNISVAQLNKELDPFI